MKLNVVGFVNKKREVVEPILAKLVFFTIAITFAMILICDGQGGNNINLIGVIFYVKEVCEFMALIYFLRRRR